MRVHMRTRLACPLPCPRPRHGHVATMQLRSAARRRHNPLPPPPAPCSGKSITSYDVQVNATNGSLVTDFSVPGTASSLSTTLSGLVPTEVYGWRVVGVNEDSDTVQRSDWAWSGWVLHQQSATVPEQVAGLYSTSQSQNALGLRWRSTVDNGRDILQYSGATCSFPLPLPPHTPRSPLVRPSSRVDHPIECNPPVPSSRHSVAPGVVTDGVSPQSRTAGAGAATAPRAIAPCARRSDLHDQPPRRWAQRHRDRVRIRIPHVSV